MLIQKKFLAGAIFFLSIISVSNRTDAQTDVWTSAYYAGWQQGYNNTGWLPAEEVDYSAVTHIIHFGLDVLPDGSIDDIPSSIYEYNANAAVTAAHNASKKILVCVGGWNTANGFRGATNTLNLVAFVNNLVNILTSRNYDGIDIDWEPFYDTDVPQFIALATLLRTTLDGINPDLLLTTSNGNEAHMFLPAVDMFDQINCMTYDMSGAWPDWVTWHNSPIYNGGYQFPCCPNQYVPSADENVQRLIDNGVPANKIGIGIDFYGYIWNGGDGTTTGGVTEPRQDYSTDPWVQSNVPYYTIMDDYYDPSNYHWDDAAQASYIRIDNSGSADDKFISYDEENTIYAKFDYIRNKGIGGLIIWELGGGYRANLPEGQRDVLLQTVKTALNGGVTNNNETKNDMPAQFTLEQNYPNPFNPSTKINFTLSSSAQVELDIFNILGEKIATLVNETLNAGRHSVTWDASNYPSGVYIYQLRSGNNLLVKKMTLTK